MSTLNEQIIDIEDAVEAVPLRTDEQGVIRVGETRVTLDTVITAFDTGATAEQIAEDYPLRLDDVYAAILYYLRHRGKVQRYLAQRRQHAEQVRRENQARFDHSGLRERLIARLGNAAAG